EGMLDPAVAGKVLEEMRHKGRHPMDQLSPRELEVLAALARGRSNKEIARDLSIGEETVKTHVSNILSKLHLADRTQAAIYGLQHRRGGAASSVPGLRASYPGGGRLQHLDHARRPPRRRHVDPAGGAGGDGPGRDRVRGVPRDFHRPPRWEPECLLCADPDRS